MGRSLRSFLFFAKEQNVLYVLSRSFEKNGKERGAQPWLLAGVATNGVRHYAQTGLADFYRICFDGYGFL